jgi:hypothetical protein
VPVKPVLNRKKLFVFGGIGVLFFIFLLLFFVQIVSHKTTNTQSTITPPVQQSETILSPTQPATTQQTQSLIYGVWTSQSSVVRAVNLVNGQMTTLAALPLTVKKISILSKNKLLYIDQIDAQENGKRLSIYNIANKQIETNIPVAQDFVMKDYILSPNKHYLAFWEQALKGKDVRSRVYTLDLTRPEVSNLLYDEKTQDNTPVPFHYPRAVLDDGTLITDTVIASESAKGMSIVEFDGSNKRDISSMQAGDYIGQPIASPDANYIAFMSANNTVGLLDTKNLRRFILPNLPQNETFTKVSWSTLTGNIVLTMKENSTNNLSLSLYDLEKQKSLSISVPTSDPPYALVTQVRADTALVGLQSTSQENIGNLGSSDEYAFTQFALVNVGDSANGTNTQLHYIATQDPFMQYMTVLEGDYGGN